MVNEFDHNVDGGYNRPRRPRDATITYLRGLPLDVQMATDEINEYMERTVTGASNSNTGSSHDNNNSHGYKYDNSGYDDGNYDQGPPVFPHAFAAAFAALDEIRNEVASLAGEEHGSQAIELLAHITAPYSEVAARVLLSGCSGYHLHLATHRYGSHVLQTILQLAVTYRSTDKSDLTTHEECPQYSDGVESLPSLEDLVHGMVEELSPHASALAIHVCGTHVLRTLLCVLGGINLLSSPGKGPNNEYRGVSGALLRGRKKDKKKKKKKKHVDGASGSAADPHAGLMHIEYCQNSRLGSVQDGMFKALETLSSALTGETSDGPGELQTLACHASAGPLLIVLLRVLTYSTDSARNAWQAAQDSNNGTANGDGGGGASKLSSISDFRLGIIRDEPKFELDSAAHGLVKRLLCWRDDVGDGNRDGQQKDVGDVLYGLSGEPRGSHVFETILRISPDSVYDDVVRLAEFEKPESMQEYSEHEVSNFVIQTMLYTIRSKEQAEVILKAVERVISSGLAIDPRKRRRGILWRAVELAAKFRVQQDSLLKAIRLGFVEFLKADKAAEADNDEEGADAGEKKKKKERKKASAVDMRDIVLRLINIQQPIKEGGRMVVDPAGCRALYHLLRFVPRLCEDTLKSITDDLSAEDLVNLAKDGLGSRCIIDGILDGPVKGPIFGAAVKALQAKLAGNWVHLALDRVGHHTVKKTFNALPKIDDKARLVEELVGAGNRMNANSMGKAVSQECAIEDYREGKKHWRQIIVKRITKVDDKWLTQLSSSSSSDPAKRNTVGGGGVEGAPETASGVTGETAQEDGNGGSTVQPTKAKRKRKRKKSAAAAAADDGANKEQPESVANDDNEGDDAEHKSKRIAQ